MKRALLALTALALAVPASAIEPRAIRSAKQVKAPNGAVRLSVRSQVQQQGTLHVWFVRTDGDPANNADVLKFERGQGVPLAGSNMMDTRPLIFAVRPGRYRLLAHGVQCPGLPPEGTFACSVTQFGSTTQKSAARYGMDAPEFEVVAGKVTDIGDVILEATEGSPIDEANAFAFMQRNARAFQIRFQPAARPLPDGFAAAMTGPPPVVAPEFRSKISCAKRPKGAALYFPFTC